MLAITFSRFFEFTEKEEFIEYKHEGGEKMSVISLEEVIEIERVDDKLYNKQFVFVSLCFN